jgi:hypothetical protein
MSTTTSGISFGGLLTIVFIVLKLVDIITWSWLWVLSPLWMPFAIVLSLAIVWFVIQWIVQR